MKGKNILIAIVVINSLIGSKENISKEILKTKNSLSLQAPELKFDNNSHSNSEKHLYINARKIIRNNDQIKSEKYVREERIKNNRVRRAKEKATRSSAQKSHLNPEHDEKWHGLKHEYSLETKQRRGKTPKTIGYGYKEQEINNIKEIE